METATSPTQAIRLGKLYVLERIRSQQLISLDPTTSGNRINGWGEPFLALDPMIVAHDLMTDSDQRAFVDRLLGSARNGAWAYAEHARVDVDTTASAIRALDRLGHRYPLDGLALFYNPKTHLYSTFFDPYFVNQDLGLQLPPQDLMKHRGSHPCVLSNVYLLLYERGLLESLSHELLDCLQRPDGHWYSYCYPSPYYATRLYTELLTSLGEEYDSYMHLTLNALMHEATPASATEAAELLISLAHLRRRFPAQVSQLQKSTESLIGQLLHSRLSDGSWRSDLAVR